MAERVSVKDRKFLDAFKAYAEQQRDPIRATVVVADRHQKRFYDRFELERLERWTLRGDEIIGRLDRVDGSRVYVSTLDYPLSFHDENIWVLPAARVDWDGISKDSPGEYTLKRSLTVADWTVTQPQTVFDRRRGDAVPAPRAGGRELGFLVRGQEQASEAAARVSEAVAEGRPASGTDLETIVEWSQALRGLLSRLGLDLNDGMNAIEKLVERAESDRRKLDEIRRIATFMAHSSLEELPAQARDGVVGTLREQLRSAIASFLADYVMDRSGGSSWGGAVWEPADRRAQQFVDARWPAPRMTLINAVPVDEEIEPRLQELLDRGLLKVERSLNG